VVKSGGRGYILGDYGSGFHYGRDALIHYLDHPKTASSTLKAAVLEVFGTDQESKIVSSLYKSGSAPQVLGRLARVLGTDATAGEPYALASLERNTSALANVVREHVNRFLKAHPSLGVSLAGGMWKGAPIFKTRFQELLQEMLPDIDLTVTRIAKPPLYGALELAKELRVGN
jgi:N-acetylglucosamine kinase-like BadF-type ATPase